MAVPDDIGRQVTAKIQSAARYANELLAIALKKKIADEQFWLHNGYATLTPAYAFSTKLPAGLWAFH